MQFTSILTLFALLALSATAAPTSHPNVVPNSYIVALKPEADLAQFTRAFRAEIARERARESDSGVVPEFGHEFSIGSSFKGFHGTLTDGLVRKLKSNPRVAAVEPNNIMRALATTQLSPPSWGLSRISQQRPGINGPYTFPDKQGEGVDVYVFDTGVLASHDEFRRGRLQHVFKAQSTWNTFDQNGHGSHVAGTIAGQRHGVAKRANIKSVKVFDGRDGPTTDIIRAVEYVTNELRRTGKTAVCNMSLSGPASDVLDRAVVALVDAGCVVVTAAGNHSQDSCTGSPSRIPQVLNVAALDQQGFMSSFSDFGRCVDVFAPGSNIRSLNFNGAVRDNSGTSMAAPHAAGAAALILGQEPGLKPNEVIERIVGNATPNSVRGDVKGSPNRVLFVRS